MNRAQAKAAVRKLLATKRQVFVLSTVDGRGAPWGRLMRGVMVKGNTMFMASDSDARKVRQIAGNPKVLVLCWTPDYAGVASVWGKASMERSPKVRRQFWNAVPGCERFYSGPDDPGLGIVRIRLTHGEYLDTPAGFETIAVKF